MCMLLMTCDPDMPIFKTRTAIGVGLVIVPVMHIMVTSFCFIVKCKESYRVMIWHRKKLNIEAREENKNLES